MELSTKTCSNPIFFQPVHGITIISEADIFDESVVIADDSWTRAVLQIPYPYCVVIRSRHQLQPVDVRVETNQSDEAIIFHEWQNLQILLIFFSKKGRVGGNKTGMVRCQRNVEWIWCTHVFLPGNTASSKKDTLHSSLADYLSHSKTDFSI